MQRSHGTLWLATGVFVALVAVMVVYVVLLFLAKFIVPTARPGTGLIAYVLIACAVCSVGGMAVLKAFSISGRASTLRLYMLGGLLAFSILTVVGNALVGDPSISLRTEVMLGFTALQWVAFALPALFYGKQILGTADSTPIS